MIKKVSVGLGILFTLLVGSLPAQQEPLKIKSIYFGGGSYWVDSMQEQELYMFLDSIKNLKSFPITIHSHTDNIGGAEYNAWLSKQRSAMLIRLLENYGVPTKNIEIQDFGQFNPVFDNSTWEGRQKNRRVDVVIWPPPL